MTPINSSLSPCTFPALGVCVETNDQQHGFHDIHLPCQRRDALLHRLWIHISRLHRQTHTAAILPYPVGQEFVFRCADSHDCDLWEWDSDGGGYESGWEGLGWDLEIRNCCVSSPLIWCYALEAYRGLGLRSGRRWHMLLLWGRRMPDLLEMRMLGWWLCCGRIGQEKSSPIFERF